jgi:phosphocarrier protein FPr/phosphocarrier protein
MADVIVRAPVDGWATSLDEVPDEVFSGRLLGDGVAIDPTGSTVHAPFDGVIGALPRSRHAVSVRSDSGVEVLIHIGLETVKLEGRGFIAHVTEGQRVTAGDLLLTLDLDRIADEAVSLITPIVVTGEGHRILTRVAGRGIRVGDPVLTLGLEAPAEAAAAGTGEASRSVRAPLPNGLHARPAARIAVCAKSFAAQVTLALGDRSASAMSAVSMMGLGVREGDDLIISATGPDARAAVDAVARLIADGLGETRETPVQAPVPPPATGPVAGADGELIFAGVAGAPGLVIGQAVHLKVAEIAVKAAGGGVAVESEALDRAIDAVRRRLEAASDVADLHKRGILAAHLALLQDPELLGAARKAIADSQGAGFAWRQATRDAMGMLRSLGDARMAERADDLLDLERQVLLELSGEPETSGLDLGEGAVVLADDLLPSQLMALDARRLRGLCIGGGGPTSHVAILAAAMGVPTLVAVGSSLDQIAERTLVVLDADGGRLVASPSAATQARAQSAMVARDRRRADARAAAHEECRTADGVRIEVFANLGAASEAAGAVAAGAEGCGLLRTEFLFLDRAVAPDEEEQLSHYQAIADALDGRPLIIRTLDAGGDKPLPYLPTPPEANPALGLRGVRTGLYRPDLLSSQLRAACRVRPTGVVALMLPMVASVAEVRQVRALLDHAARETGCPPPLLGVMIETPAAAVTTDLLAEVVDFVSIGTNDLTQYALAMDRQNPHLAPQLDGLHPAVLRLIAQAADGAAATRWIGVCGGLASDVLAAPLLVGLGVRELSATPAMVAEIKAAVRTFALAECRELAAAALGLDSPEAVRALAAEAGTRAARPRKHAGADA